MAEPGAHRRSQLATVDPVVSVIIPAFNAASFLERAIDSALGQAVDVPLEVIVVDDASTDGTSSVASGFDDRVRVVRLPGRSGAAAARNEGVRRARGRFVAFLDADDEWLPGRLSAGLEPMVSDASVGATFCLAAVRLPDGATHTFGSEVRPRWAPPRILWPDAQQCTPATICRRTALDAVGLMDAGLRAYEDQDLWIRLLERFRVVRIDEVLVVVHARHEGLSRSTPVDEQERDFRIVIERALARAPDRYAAHRRELWYDAEFRWADVRLAQGDRSGSRRRFARAFLLRPSVAALSGLALASMPMTVVEWIRVARRRRARPTPPG